MKSKSVSGLKRQKTKVKFPLTRQQMREPKCNYDFGPLMDTHIARATVVFVHIGSQTNPQCTAYGSGTLVKFGNVEGILTCAHVVEALKELENEGVKEIGILCFPARSQAIQSARLKLSHLVDCTIGAKKRTKSGMKWTRSGPDIAFLRVPAPDLSALKAKCTVINGLKQRQLFLQNEPDADGRIDAVSGVLAEKTMPADVSGLNVTTVFEAVINVGRNVKLRPTKQLFDLLTFTPVPDENYVYPSNVKGQSGGGLWRLYYRTNKDGSKSIVRALLAGVAFWENGNRDIICHGPSSIYNHLLAIIKKKWPDDV